MLRNEFAAERSRIKFFGLQKAASMQKPQWSDVPEVAVDNPKP